MQGWMKRIFARLLTVISKFLYVSQNDGRVADFIICQNPSAQTFLPQSACAPPEPRTLACLVIWQTPRPIFLHLRAWQYTRADGQQPVPDRIQEVARSS